MKQIFTCLLVAAICFCKTATLFAQVNVNDSIALVNLYDSAKGRHWTNHTNWLTASPVTSWYGITVQNGRVSSLRLPSNNLSGRIPSSLGNLANLQILDLYNNQLSGSIPASLGNLTNLSYLYFNVNQLSGSIPASLGNLINLQYLDMYSNQLSGSIPASLGNLTNLRYLYLNGNRLSGKIPASLGNLVNLVVTYLGANHLNGKIPASLGKLIHLTGLGLASGQLKGNIPGTLDSLPSSASIYLWGNSFTFRGIEHIVQTHPNTYYAPQANIPVKQNGNILLVNAGGTLSNNTYKWYKNSVLVATNTGVSTFTTAGAGKYNAVVTNSIATALTLYSDTITTTSFAADKNIISKATAKTFIYPNPADKIIHLNLDKPATENMYCIIYNVQGKALMQQKIAQGSSTEQYTISNLAAGNYLLVILEKGKKVHEEPLVIIH